LFDAVRADAWAQEGSARAAGHVNPLEEGLQVPDDVQAGQDSPRDLHRGAHRRSMTPLLARSRASTPGPLSKLD
jgi:hypothetical protein